jgi:hypothetical protein
MGLGIAVVAAGAAMSAQQISAVGAAGATEGNDVADSPRLRSLGRSEAVQHLEEVRHAKSTLEKVRIRSVSESRNTNKLVRKTEGTKAFSQATMGRLATRHGNKRTRRMVSPTPMHAAKEWKFFFFRSRNSLGAESVDGDEEQKLQPLISAGNRAFREGRMEGGEAPRQKQMMETFRHGYVHNFVCSRDR